MIPQNNSNFNSDSSDFNSDRSNADEQETLTNRSPNEGVTQSDVSYLDQAYDKYLDSYELNEDKRKWSAAARAAYVQAKRESAVRPDDSCNLAVRPGRYDPTFGDVVISSRLDYLSFTVNEKYMSRFERYCRKILNLVWHDRGKGTQWYNHSKETACGLGFCEYSKNNDPTGVANNKGKATYTFKGKFFKSVSLIQQMELLVFIVQDCKATNITRIDARMADESKYFLPEQIGGYLEHTYKTTGKYPVTNIRVNLDKGCYPTLNGGAERYTLKIGKEEMLVIYDGRVKHNEDNIPYEDRLKGEKATCFAKHLVDEYQLHKQYALNDIKNEVKEEFREKRKQSHYDFYLRCIQSAKQDYLDEFNNEVNNRLNDYLQKLIHALICQVVLSSHDILDVDGNIHPEWQKFKELVGVVESYRPHKATPVRALDKCARFLKKNVINAYIAIAGHFAGFKDWNDIEKFIKEHGIDALLPYMHEFFLDFFKETIEEQLTNNKFKYSIHAKKLMAQSLTLKSA